MAAPVAGADPEASTDGLGDGGGLNRNTTTTATVSF